MTSTTRYTAAEAAIIAAAVAAERTLRAIAQTRRPTDEETAEANRAYRAAAIVTAPRETYGLAADRTAEQTRASWDVAKYKTATRRNGECPKCYWPKSFRGTDSVFCDDCGTERAIGGAR